MRAKCTLLERADDLGARQRAAATSCLQAEHAIRPIGSSETGRRRVGGKGWPSAAEREWGVEWGCRVEQERVALFHVSCQSALSGLRLRLVGLQLLEKLLWAVAVEKADVQKWL